jgi:ATP-dependent Clp protease ATP-binding subunit ClpB
LRYGTLAALERDLSGQEEAITKAAGGTRLIREEVGPDDIAMVISRWTGIPVTRLMEGEREKLLP